MLGINHAGSPCVWTSLAGQSDAGCSDINGDSTIIILEEKLMPDAVVLHLHQWSRATSATTSLQAAAVSTAASAHGR